MEGLIDPSNGDRSMIGGNLPEKKTKRRHRQEDEDYAIAREGMSMKRKRIQPVIIHHVNPPLYHADPSDFLRVVQKLTGCPATRLRCDDAATLLNRAAESPTSRSSSIVGSPASSISSTATSLSSTAASRHTDNGAALERNAGPSDGVAAGSAEDVEIHSRELVPGMSTKSLSLSRFCLDASEPVGFSATCSAGLEHTQRQHHRLSNGSTARSQPEIYPPCVRHYYTQNSEPFFMKCFKDWISSFDNDGYWSSSSISEDAYDELLLY